MSSTLRIHLRRDAPRGYRSAYLGPERQAKMGELVRALQHRGLVVSPSCQLCLSTAMSKDHIDQMVAAVDESIRTLDLT